MRVYERKGGHGVGRGICSLYVVYTLTGCLLAGYYLRVGDMARLWLVLVNLLCLVVPRSVARLFRVELSPLMEGSALLFLMLTGYLGEVWSFYERISVWDNFMHLFSGVMFCAFGYGLFLPEEEESASHSRGGRLTFGLSFALAAGVIWEFIEYTLDASLGTTMQKHTIRVGIEDTGLIDTMEDMAFGLVGAVLYVIRVCRFPAQRQHVSDDDTWGAADKRGTTPPKDRIREKKGKC